MKCAIQAWKAEFENLKQARLTLLIDKRYLADLPQGDNLTVEITKEKKKRTLSANAYCWVLCEKLAEKVGTTKEEIYREAVTQVGVCQMLTMKRDATDRFEEIWKAQGMGFQCFIAGQHGDFVDVIAYIGSSKYNREEMARLIDWLAEEAERQGIDTRTPLERARMLDEWGEV